LINLGSIDPAEIERQGYTIQWFITDIAKYIILQTISKASEIYGFNYVLGGGSCLNDIYFPRRYRRFSRDIDLYMVDLSPHDFVLYLNNVLRGTGMYREHVVFGEKLVTQGFIYVGETRLNHVYKYRMELPQSIGCGLKLSDIIPYRIKRLREFNKWWMEHKSRLPRIYEIEVSVFKGRRPYAHPVETRDYLIDFLEKRGYKPVSVRVFSLEDLVAGKIEGIVSAFVSRGFLKGRVTGRRELKPRDIYDLAIVFSNKMYSREKIIKSIDTLRLDIMVALKALRLVLLHSLCNPQLYYRLLAIAPHLRGNIEFWIETLYRAYHSTLDIMDHTPDDYIVYILITKGKIDREAVKKRFKISDPQITKIIHRLEELGIGQVKT